MNREELIEEAAVAMYEASFDHAPSWEPDERAEWINLARAAFAVYAEAWSHERTVNIPRAGWERLKRFEQAHTPTEAHEKPFDTSPERVNIGADSLHVNPTDDEREYDRDMAVMLSQLVDDEPMWSCVVIAKKLHAAGFRRTVQGEPSAHRFEGESDPIASNPILRGVDLALERLVRRDCFTERTMRIVDELRAEVLAATQDGENRG